MERRPRSESTLRKLFVGAQAATALGTPLLFVPTGSLTVDLAVFSLGALLTGFGGMALWLLWGVYYAAVPQEETERLVPLSAALGAAVLLVVSATSGWVGLACISVMPLASAACFVASRRSLEAPLETTAREPAAPKPALLKDALQGMVRVGVGLCTIALFWQLLNQLQVEGLATLGSYQIAIAFSIAFTLAVAFVSLSRPRHVSMPSLYRWICPTLALGCVTTAWLGGMWGETVTLTLLIGVRFAYCMIIVLFFARYATERDISPITAFGLGKFFVCVGDILGIALGMLLREGVVAGVLSLDRSLLLAMTFAFVACLFVLSNSEELRAPSQCTLSQEEAAPIPDAIAAGAAVVADRYRLTPREAEVLLLLGRGRSVPFIRDELLISRQTAAVHVKHIYTKTGVHSKQEFIDLITSSA